MKRKRKIGHLSSAIVLAGIVYLPQASADVFEFGTIKTGDLFAVTVNGMEGVELGTFDPYNEDYILVKQSQKNEYKNKFIYTKYILSNYTYSIDNIVTSNNTTNNGNYSQSMSISNVPEPEEWAMTLVGVGLVSYQIRRKQKRLNNSNVS